MPDMPDMRFGASLALAGALVLVGATACRSDGGGDEVHSGDDTSASSLGEADASDTSEIDTSESDSTTAGMSCDPSNTLVESDFGPLVGVAEQGVTRFLGVPYAAPPLGELRFAAPLPPPSWAEPRDASSFGERCVQLVAADETTTIGSEDCLLLNVWTPAACPDGDRPVLVFIHGGGNATGSAVDPLYDGAELARREDVVVVTLDYRLGVLGWLALPELDAEAGRAGNYGLADQLAALDWVRAHAARLGGDPDRIMLFGESAGAVDTCALIGSPQAQGKLAGAIVQSGTCKQLARAQLDALADELVASSGCAGPDVLACLRARPAAELMALAPTGFPSVSALSQGWGPHVDGELLPTTTLDALAAGEVGIPLVVGSNVDETAKDAPPGLSEAQYEALVGATFGPLAPSVLAQYPVADYDDPSDAWANLTTDVKFTCTARRSAEASALGGQPTWRYVFGYVGYETFGQSEPLAFHGLELVYLFGNWGAVELGNFEYQPNADDLAMRDVMMGAWAEFAATGQFAGPLYDPRSDPHQGLGIPAGSHYRAAQCDFWDAWP